MSMFYSNHIFHSWLFCLLDHKMARKGMREQYDLLIVSCQTSGLQVKWFTTNYLYENRILLSFLDLYSAYAGAPPFGVVLVLIKVSKLL